MTFLLLGERSPPKKHMCWSKRVGQRVASKGVDKSIGYRACRVEIGMQRWLPIFPVEEIVGSSDHSQLLIVQHDYIQVGIVSLMEE